MSDDWKTYVNLKMTTNTAVRHPETGETVWFHPGDDPPDWARQLMGPHCFGFAMQKHEPPALGADGLPMRIRVVCATGRGGCRKTEAVFDVFEYLGDSADGTPEFTWAHRHRRPNAYAKRKVDETTGRQIPGEQIERSVSIRCARGCPSIQRPQSTLDPILSKLRAADQRVITTALLEELLTSPRK